uniref:hypothetical protein n=1 Tax=Thaumasiovibrio occultus TaxID=1891184 RepID=UPI000B35E5C9|nr:hypothetical protein [Thaumasiovibrio occultus]
MLLKRLLILLLIITSSFSWTRGALAFEIQQTAISMSSQPAAMSQMNDATAMTSSVDELAQNVSHCGSMMQEQDAQMSAHCGETADYQMEGCDGEGDCCITVHCSYSTSPATFVAKYPSNLALGQFGKLPFDFNRSVRSEHSANLYRPPIA